MWCQWWIKWTFSRELPSLHGSSWLYDRQDWKWVLQNKHSTSSLLHHHWRPAGSQPWPKHCHAFHHPWGSSWLPPWHSAPVLTHFPYIPCKYCTYIVHILVAYSAFIMPHFATPMSSTAATVENLHRGHLHTTCYKLHLDHLPTHMRTRLQQQLIWPWSMWPLGQMSKIFS